MKNILKTAFLLVCLLFVSSSDLMAQSEEFKRQLCKTWVLSQLENNGVKETPDDYLLSSSLVINKDFTGKAIAPGQVYPGKWKYNENLKEFTLSGSFGVFRLKLENLSDHELVLSYFEPEEKTVYKVYLIPGK